MLSLKYLFVCSLILGFAAGCGHRHPGKTIGNLDQPVDPKARVAILEKMKSGKAGRPEKAAVHLELAQIYYQCSNPNLNYAKALEELEAYVSLEPEKSDSAELRNQLAVLRELEKQRKANRTLEKMNAELSDTMKKLQTLDVQLEKKRESAKQGLPDNPDKIIPEAIPPSN